MLKGLQKRRPAHHFGILTIFELEVWRTSRHRKGCLTSHLLSKTSHQIPMSRVPSLDQEDQNVLIDA